MNLRQKKTLDQRRALNRFDSEQLLPGLQPRDFQTKNQRADNCKGDMGSLVRFQSIQAIIAQKTQRLNLYKKETSKLEDQLEKQINKPTS